MNVLWSQAKVGLPDAIEKRADGCVQGLGSFGQTVFLRV